MQKRSAWVVVPDLKLIMRLAMILPLPYLNQVRLKRNSQLKLTLTRNSWLDLLDFWVSYLVLGNREAESSQKNIKKAADRSLAKKKVSEGFKLSLNMPPTLEIMQFACFVFCTIEVYIH